MIKLFYRIKSYFTIPYHLTILRIGIGIWLFCLLLNFRIDNGFFILPLFMIGALAGIFDNNAILNSIADRILILPIAFYSLISYNKTLLFLLLFMEILNGLISLFVMHNRIQVKDTIFGKEKMALQLGAFSISLIFWPHSPNFILVGALWASLIFMAISIIFNIKSIALYYGYDIKKYPYLQYPFWQKRRIKAV